MSFTEIFKKLCHISKKCWNANRDCSAHCVNVYRACFHGGNKSGTVCITYTYMIVHGTDTIGCLCLQRRHN